MHVVEPPGIRLLLSYRMRFLFGIVAIPRVLSKTRRVISKTVPRRSSRTVGVLPLGFGRQAIGHRFFGCKSLAELHRVFPRHLLHWVTGTFEVAWILPHHFLVFRLRYFVYTKVERLGDPNLVLRFRPVICIIDRLGRAHHELACRDQLQLHADSVGDLDIHTKVLGPCFLMCVGLFGIERGFCEWRRAGGLGLWRSGIDRLAP